MHHLNMSYGDVIKLPVTYRKWFLNRLSEEFKQVNEERKKRSQSRRGNTREVPMGDIGGPTSSTPQPGKSNIGVKSFK